MNNLLTTYERILIVCLWKSAKFPEVYALKYVKKSNIAFQTEVFVHHNKCLFMDTNFMQFAQ
uniref:hypothetical protein n=1 Tax=Chryseobacterium fistulae TaxID=2675058 RepID=UPI0013897BB3